MATFKGKWLGKYSLNRCYGSCVLGGFLLSRHACEGTSLPNELLVFFLAGETSDIF